MAIVSVHAIFPSKTGLDEDDAVNVLHFGKATALDSTDQSTILTAVDAFYGTGYVGPSNTRSLSNWMAGSIDRAACITKMYDVPPASPGAGPVATGTLSMDTAVSNDSLPAQACVVLSFRGGTPTERRKRGRLYLGPLCASAAQMGSTTRIAEVDENLRAQAALACEGLAESSALAARGISWVVYSRADGVGYQIRDGHVDDRFDTQKRRLPTATARSTWT